MIDNPLAQSIISVQISSRIFFNSLVRRRTKWDWTHINSISFRIGAGKRVNGMRWKREVGRSRTDRHVKSIYLLFQSQRPKGTRDLLYLTTSSPPPPSRELPFQPPAWVDATKTTQMNYLFLNGLISAWNLLSFPRALNYPLIIVTVLSIGLIYCSMLEFLH